MMGNRGSANGTEMDAFSRKSREMMFWRAGELRTIKRAFSKRMRRIVKRNIRSGDDA